MLTGCARLVWSGFTLPHTLDERGERVCGRLRKRTGVTGVFTLVSRPCANRLKVPSLNLAMASSHRGDGVRSISRVGSVLVVVAVFGLVFGGCGSISSSLVKESSMLASRTPVSAPVESEADQPSASPSESEPATTPVVITYEPVTS